MSDNFIARGGVGALPLRLRAGHDRDEFDGEIRRLLDAAWLSLEASQA